MFICNNRNHTRIWMYTKNVCVCVYVYECLYVSPCSDLVSGKSSFVFLTFDIVNVAFFRSTLLYLMLWHRYAFKIIVLALDVSVAFSFTSRRLFMTPSRNGRKQTQKKAKNNKENQKKNVLDEGRIIGKLLLYWLDESRFIRECVCI